MSDHALISPSRAHRSLGCVASLAMEELVGAPDKTGREGREGTAAHELAEKFHALREVNLDAKVSDFLGDKIEVEGEVFTINQEMVDAVETYWNYIDAIPHRETYVEKRVEYAHLVKDGYGFSDCFFEGVEKIDGKPVNTLWVIDFKYGKNVFVDAYENTQGKLYATGALRTYDHLFRRVIQRVVIVIIQPRMDNISEFEISVDDLKKWGKEWVKPRAKFSLGYLNYAKDMKPQPDADGKHDLILKPDAFCPGRKTCQWCRAKHKCKACAKTVFETALDGFTDLTAEEQSDFKNNVPVFKNKPTIDVFAMSNEDISAALKVEKIVDSFFKELKELAIKKMMDGEDIPGFKPVRGLKNREWKLNENETIHMLFGYFDINYECSVESLKSPAQVKADLKAKYGKGWESRWQNLEKDTIHRPPGDIKIAFENAKAPSIAPVDDSEDFLDMSEDTDDTDDMDFLEL